MLQINPFLDCTLYSRITVHIGQNTQPSNVIFNLIEGGVTVLFTDKMTG